MVKLVCILRSYCDSYTYMFSDVLGKDLLNSMQTYIMFLNAFMQVGGTGGLFGLLAVTLVELLQGWKWVHRPCAELFKILFFITILLCKFSLTNNYVLY